MQTIYFTLVVNGQHVAAVHPQALAADSRNLLRMRLGHKDTIWDGIVKTAVFTGPDGTAYNVLVKDDECAVPAEVIRAPGFHVSIYGGDLVTADVAFVPVEASGLADGVAPPEPTPDIYTQLVAAVTEQRDAAAASAAASAGDAVQTQADRAAVGSLAGQAQSDRIRAETAADSAAWSADAAQASRAEAEAAESGAKAARAAAEAAKAHAEEVAVDTAGKRDETAAAAASASGSADAAQAAQAAAEAAKARAETAADSARTALSGISQRIRFPAISPNVSSGAAVTIETANGRTTSTYVITSAPSYAYTYFKLPYGRQELLENRPRITCLCLPDFTASIGVILSNKPDWSMGVTFISNEVSVSAGAASAFVMDFGASAYDTLLNTETADNAVYVLVAIKSSYGGNVTASGTYRLQQAFYLSTDDLGGFADYSAGAANAENAANATHAENAANAATVESAGTVYVGKSLAKGAGAGAEIGMEAPNRAYIRYAAGSATGSVYIARIRIGTVGDLKGRKIYVKTFRRSTDSSDNFTGYVFAFNFLSYTDWGDALFTERAGAAAAGLFIDGDALRAKAYDRGQTDGSPVYAFLCNMYSYTAQTAYSVDAAFECFILKNSDENPVFAGRIGKYNEADLDRMQSAVGELAEGGYITCWGDSLTAGGGWPERLAALSGLTVYNAGTGGEDSKTIMARQGGDAMMVNRLVIPAGTSPVVIAERSTDGGIQTVFGNTAAPLLQGGGSHVNPVSIAGISGTLAWTGSSYADMNGNWTFTRSVPGEAVTIDRPTAIVTKADREWNHGINILFMGQNGGYADIDSLIWQHRQMISHSTARKTIVLGFSSGSASGRAEYEAAMRAEFGRYFISLRQYLAAPLFGEDGTTITSCFGLADAGLTPTPEDLTAIASGTVPPQLLSDSVHYTSAAKTVIGNMLYKKMAELGLV